MNQGAVGTKHIFTGLLLIAGLCLFPAVAPAQGGPHPGPPRWGHAGFPPGGFGGHRFAKVVTGEPYSAQAVTTMKQTLADGTTITHTITASIARDSEGRTMRSQIMKGFGAANAASGTTIVTIFDPVANQRIEYNTSGKTARIFMLPQNRGAASHPGRGRGRDGRGWRGRSQAGVTTQTLTGPPIDGLEVVGTKTTRTIAAGAIGNDKPLISTEETWYSNQYQMVLQSTRNDPRFGQTTYAVSDFSAGEPNAALFQVPAGYQTRTVGPRTVGPPSRHSEQ